MYYIFRALKRVADERKQREIKELEIQKKQRELEAKLNEELELKLKLEKNMKYQDYLEMIVQNVSKYFPEIKDILKRHQILKNANKDLQEKQVLNEREQERLNREYTSYVKEKENKILNANNEIAELQIKLEKKKLLASELQAEVDQRTNEITQKSLFLGQIISTISNLLERCEENFKSRHNKVSTDSNAVSNNQISNISSQVLPNSNNNGIVNNGSHMNQESVSVLILCDRALNDLNSIEQYMIDFKSVKEEYEKEYGLINSSTRLPRVTVATLPSINGVNSINAGRHANITSGLSMNASLSFGSSGDMNHSESRSMNSPRLK